MLYPMLFMIILTFIVGLIAVKARFASVKSGAVDSKYFKLMQGNDVPEMVIKSTRSFNNMFEVPVLFYTACTLYVALGIHSTGGIILAWLFVVFRYIHAYIHLTYNHVLHRMWAFWAALICVLALWVNLVIQNM